MTYKKIYIKKTSEDKCFCIVKKDTLAEFGVSTDIPSFLEDEKANIVIAEVLDKIVNECFMPDDYLKTSVSSTPKGDLIMEVERVDEETFYSCKDEGIREISPEIPSASEIVITPFRNITDVFIAARRLPSSICSGSALYKGRNGVFFLSVNCPKEDDSIMLSLILSDYSMSNYYDAIRPEHYYKTHCETVIKDNAVQVLKTILVAPPTT